MPIDKDKIQQAIDGKISSYEVEEELPPASREILGLPPVHEVMIHIQARRNNLSLTLSYLYNGREWLSYINNWRWTQPWEPDRDALYYLAISLPLGILKKLIAMNPSIFARYDYTLSDDDEELTIIRNPITNDYITIWSQDGHLHLEESYAVAVVPKSLYHLARELGIPIISL